MFKKLSLNCVQTIRHLLAVAPRREILTKYRTASYFEMKELVLKIEVSSKNNELYVPVNQ